MASTLISLLALGSSFLVTWQLKARANYVEPQKPLFQDPAINLLHLPPLGIFWLSAAEIEQKSGELFATPNSIGAIALGAAEGTRTHNGGKTLIWKRHTDPGNGAENKGTFAWQLGAKTPEEADLKGLARLRYEAIPYLIQQAEQQEVGFDISTLVHGADLWNQSPDAGADFVKNLNRCLHRDLQDDDAIILCARIESFYNPETLELEASGFDSDPQQLEQDQIRRMQAIQQVLKQHQQQVAITFQPES
jgi:hypothetical protein